MLDGDETTPGNRGESSEPGIYARWGHLQGYAKSLSYDAFQAGSNATEVNGGK